MRQLELNCGELSLHWLNGHFAHLGFKKDAVEVRQGYSVESTIGWSFAFKRCFSTTWLKQKQEEVPHWNIGIKLSADCMVVEIYRCIGWRHRSGNRLFLEFPGRLFLTNRSFSSYLRHINKVILGCTGYGAIYFLCEVQSGLHFHLSLDIFLRLGLYCLQECPIKTH